MSETTPTTTSAAYATVEELKQQEFIYHDDQSDPSGEPSAPHEELSKTQIIMDVVKSLRTGKDLYRISLPAALLRPVSMLEYIGLFVSPQSFFVKYVVLCCCVSMSMSIMFSSGFVCVCVSFEQFFFFS